MKVGLAAPKQQYNTRNRDFTESKVNILFPDSD